MNTCSLRFRLIAWYAGVLALAFMLLVALTVVLLQHYLEANPLETQARRARQIAGTLIAHAEPATEAHLRGELESLYSPELNDRLIRITRADGTIVYASGAPKDAAFDPAAVAPLPADATPSTAHKVSLAGTALLIASVTASGGRGSCYRVEVGTSAAPA